MVVRTDQIIDIGARRLRATTWGSGPPEVIVLHDGLGSIEQWRSFPAVLAKRTGLTVLAYDRAGHGHSTPLPGGAWPADWLHREAEVLRLVIDEVGASDPALVGHSDGGSIAAIHAATEAVSSPLVLLAAHSWTEPCIAAEIRDLRANRHEIVPRLARFHSDPEAIFEAWSGVWTSADFAAWDIRPLIAGITAPTCVAQGVDDEYASPEHATVTAAAIGDNASAVLIPGVTHLMHRSQPDATVATTAEFITGNR